MHAFHIDHVPHTVDFRPDERREWLFRALRGADQVLDDWPPFVSLTPFVHGPDGEPVQVAGMRVVICERTRRILATTTASYGLVHHDEVLGHIDEALRMAGLTAEVEDYSFSRRGCRMVVFIKVPEIVVEGPDGTDMVLSLLVQNGIDGRTALRVRVGAFRSVCLNMMVSGTPVMDIRRWHSTRIHDHLEGFRVRLTSLLLDATSHLETLIKPFGGGFRSGVNATLAWESIVRDAGLPGVMTPDPSLISDDMQPWELINAFTASITHNRGSGLERRAGYLRKVHHLMQPWLERSTSPAPRQ